MSNETQNEQKQNEAKQSETKHPEQKRGAVLKKMVSLAGEAARGMVSRGRWLIYTQRGRRMIAGLAVTGMVGGVVAAQPVCMIEPGEVGIRVNRLTGNVSELHEGWSLLVPEVHRLSRYSLKDQTYQPSRSARASDPAPFQSVEGLSIGVEVNIRRVCERVRGERLNDHDAEVCARELAGGLGSRDRLLALMDLGATVCTARAPACERCPVFNVCATRGVHAAETKHRQSRFEGSFRQRRGVVMAQLRTGSVRASELDVEVLASLLDDGLAEVTRGRAHLPRVRGSSTGARAPTR